MNILTLDFETYFDDDYTLKKLTTEDYIRNPKFEALGCGFMMGNEARYVERPDLPAFLARLDWANLSVLAHHAHFDGLILSHHYGFHPKMWLDTLSMARLMLGNHLSVGLESLARHYGLQGKTVPYDDFRGLHWIDIPDPVRRTLAEGCLHDIRLCYDIFCRLMRGERGAI